MRSSTRRIRKAHPRLGFDIGRVVIDGSEVDLLKPAAPRERKERVGETFLVAPGVPGMLRALRRVVEQWGLENVWLISACDAQVENLVRAWLEYRGFFDTTGVSRDHVYYCPTFAAKALIAAELRLTDFVDDHPEVHHHLARVVPRRYLFRPDPQVLLRCGGVSKGVVEVYPPTARGLYETLSRGIRGELDEEFGIR